MSWNPFKKKAKDIELPNESGNIDPRLEAAMTPVKGLKEAIKPEDAAKNWRKIQSEAALKGLR